MLNEIHKSDRFKQDYERYSSAISQLPDSDFKDQMNNTLTKLINEIKKLDSLHLEMVYTRQLPSMGTDIKSTITELRRDLETNLKRYLTPN
jgi:hypothetical protein